MRAVLSPRPPRPGLLLAAVLVAVAAAYAPALRGTFVWDDRMLILDQPQIATLRPLPEYFTTVFWGKSPSFLANPVYYRPVVTLSYALDWARSGGDPVQFHLTNLALHLAATALVFVLGTSLGASGTAAALAAGAFGLFPRSTESVAWISGRTDVLAAVFSLGALVLHAGTRSDGLRRALAALLLLLGLLAKEVAAAAVVAVVVLEWLRSRGQRWTAVAVRLAPAAAAVSAYVALRMIAVSGTPSAKLRILDPLPASARIAAPLQAIGAYALMLLDPLRPRHQVGLVRVIDPVYVGLGVVALAALGGVLARRQAWRIRPETWAMLAMAGVGVGLVLHVIPVRLNVLAADRFLYLPAAGLALAVALEAYRLSPGARRVLGVAATSLLLAFGVATTSRAADWGDEVRLWRVAVGTTPAANVLPRFELGNVLFRAGRFQDALELWEASLPHASRGERVSIRGNVASALSELGRFDEARAITLDLLAFEPGIALHAYNLGIIEARRLRFEESLRWLDEALAILPGYRDAARARALVAEARADLAALPPETAGEPAHLRARRAGIDAKLGRRREAEARWVDVLEDPSVPEGEARTAIRWLLSSGTPEGAERALASMGARGLVSRPELEALRSERRRRDRSGALAEPGP